MTIDTQTHVEAIKQHGFTIIESLLDEAEVAMIREACSPWLQGDKMGRNDFEGYKTERVYSLLAKDPALALIVEHPDVLAIVDAFLEKDYLLSSNLAINCHPGETPQAFHRDNNGGRNGDINTTYGISTIWNVDDFTANNGATEVIPGSHRWTDEQPGRDDSRGVKVLLPKGSVIVFSGWIYHRGGANNSTMPRLAITPQYCQPWLRQLENMTLAVTPDKAMHLSERVQSLLGYSVRAPGFTGMVDGMHPKRLIDKAYQGRKARGQAS